LKTIYIIKLKLIQVKCFSTPNVRLLVVYLCI